MKWIRRYLVVQTLMLWQGGFLFYSAAVVPIGTRILGSAAAQGIITARVTEVLNICGLAGLAALGWDLLICRDTRKLRANFRWICWSIAGVSQVTLIVLHGMLTSLMDPTHNSIVGRTPFTHLHGAYLWVSTTQWVMCLAMVWLTLRAWGSEDSITVAESARCI